MLQFDLTNLSGARLGERLSFSLDEGPQQFVGKEPAALFHSTESDAGVWLTSPAWIREVGGANERMMSWGFQQSVMQRALRWKAKVEMLAIPEYLRKLCYGVG